ncbi:uncharacterized protein ACIB01_013161 isoform 1-T2 [Guaruba guarouba]
MAMVLAHSLARSVNAHRDHARALPVPVPCSDLMLHPGSAASSWPGWCAAAKRNLGLKPTNQTGEGRSQTPLFPGDPTEKLNPHQNTNEITQLLTSLCPLCSSISTAPDLLHPTSLAQAHQMLLGGARWTFPEQKPSLALQRWEYSWLDQGHMSTPGGYLIGRLHQRRSIHPVPRSNRLRPPQAWADGAATHHGLHPQWPGQMEALDLLSHPATLGGPSLGCSWGKPSHDGTKANGNSRARGRAVALLQRQLHGTHRDWMLLRSHASLRQQGRHVTSKPISLGAAGAQHTRDAAGTSTDPLVAAWPQGKSEPRSPGESTRQQQGQMKAGD